MFFLKLSCPEIQTQTKRYGQKRTGTEHGQIDSWTDRWTDRWMDGRTDRQTGRGIDDSNRKEVVVVLEMILEIEGKWGGVRP